MNTRPALSLSLPVCACLALLGACTVMPNGPSVLVLPGTNKNFDQFRADDFSCRGYAQAQIGGGSAQQAGTDSAVRSAALGTVLGAAIGAAADGGHGAGVGAASGLAFGTLAGTGSGSGAAYGVQQRYDFAYQQCMYAQGHRVPVSGRLTSDIPAGASYPPPNTPPPR